MGKRLYQNLAEAVFSRTAKAAPDECWDWTGAFSGSGYGALKVNGRMIGAHRAAYELANGEIQPGVYICYKCDNKKCVNPRHLFAGTAADNMADKVAKGRQFKGEALSAALKSSPAFQGSVKRGEKHPRSKLTDEQRDEILIMLDSGMTQAEIGSKYGVSQTAVYWVKKTYKTRAA